MRASGARQLVLEISGQLAVERTVQTTQATHSAAGVRNDLHLGIVHLAIDSDYNSRSVPAMRRLLLDCFWERLRP